MIIDFDRIKKTKGRLSGFIMGLISSSFGLHYALVVGLMAIIDQQTLGFSAFSRESTIVIGVITLVLSIINLAGAALIRSRRIVGGALMLFAGVPLFSLAVLEPLSFSFFLLTAAVGVTSAILAFIPYSDRYLSDLQNKKQYKKDFQEYMAQRQASPQQYYNQPYQPEVTPQYDRKEEQTDQGSTKPKETDW